MEKVAATNLVELFKQYKPQEATPALTEKDIQHLKTQKPKSEKEDFGQLFKDLAQTFEMNMSQLTENLNSTAMNLALCKDYVKKIAAEVLPIDHWYYQRLVKNIDTLETREDLYNYVKNIMFKAYGWTIQNKVRERKVKEPFKLPKKEWERIITPKTEETKKALEGLANFLDENGLTKEASIIDKLIFADMPTDLFDSIVIVGQFIENSKANISVLVQELTKKGIVTNEDEISMLIIEPLEGFVKNKFGQSVISNLKQELVQVADILDQKGFLVQSDIVDKFIKQSETISDIVDEIMEENEPLDNIPGGEADGKKPEEFDREQLEKGIKIEMKEHTNKDPQIGAEISMDHQSESKGHNKDYYNELPKMEKKLEEESSLKQQLVVLADSFDKKGLSEEANEIDKIITGWFDLSQPKALIPINTTRAPSREHVRPYNYQYRDEEKEKRLKPKTEDLEKTQIMPIVQ